MANTFFKAKGLLTDYDICCACRKPVGVKQVEGKEYHPCYVPTAYIDKYFVGDVEGDDEGMHWKEFCSECCEKIIESGMSADEVFAKYPEAPYGVELKDLIQEYGRDEINRRFSSIKRYIKAVIDDGEVPVADDSATFIY